MSSWLDKGHFTMSIFVDLKKAFDIVDQTIMLKKIEYYGKYTRSVCRLSKSCLWMK